MQDNGGMLFWTALGAIGQLIAFPALLFAAWTFFRSAKMQHYDELDDMYAAILSCRFENPESCIPNPSSPEASKLKYENHAYMTWNFIETVYDRIGNDTDLLETWQPVVTYEANLHSDWFNVRSNRNRFKERFIQRMECLLPNVILSLDRGR